MSGKRVRWLSGVLCVVGLAAGPGLAEEVSFAPVVHYPAGDHPTGLAACDFDGDGDLDLAVATYVLTLLFNDGTGAFGDLVTFNELWSQSVACGDLDGDGDNDIVVGSGYIEGNLLLFNDGSGIFTPVEGPATDPETTVLYSNGVTLCDFDSDGDLDLGFATGLDYNAERKIEIFRNRGDGTFTHGRGFTVVRYWKDLHGIACADLEGDGTSDFIGYADAFRNFIVLGSLPHGSFQWRHMHGLALAPVDVAYGELDGEPGIDAVVVQHGHPGRPNQDSQVRLLRNDGSGELVSWIDLPPAMTPGLLAVDLCDLDLDGRLDLVVTDTDNRGVSMVLNRTNGFHHAAYISTFTTGESVICDDLNGDGLPDIVINSWSTNKIGVLINTTDPGP